MHVSRNRRTAIKDAIVSALLAAGHPLLAIRLRTNVEAQLSTRTFDSTWCEALQRLTTEGLIVNPSSSATSATNQSLIAELTSDELTTGPGEISLTNRGRLYALALLIESYAMPERAADAKAAVEMLLFDLVTR